MPPGLKPFSCSRFLWVIIGIVELVCSKPDNYAFVHLDYVRLPIFPEL